MQLNSTTNICRHMNTQASVGVVYNRPYLTFEAARNSD